MNRTEITKKINSELKKLPKIKGNEYTLFMKSTVTKDGTILNSLKIKVVRSL